MEYNISLLKINLKYTFHDPTDINIFLLVGYYFGLFISSIIFKIKEMKPFASLAFFLKFSPALKPSLADPHLHIRSILQVTLRPFLPLT